MGFIKFTEVGKNFAPRVIMTPGGVISFNHGARKKFDLDSFSHIVMYMDADDHTIGFELVHDENLDGANRMRHIRRDGVDIDGRAFLKHFKLRVKKPLSFRIGEDTKTGWLFLRLDEGEIVDRVVLRTPSPVTQHPVYMDDDGNVQVVRSSDQKDVQRPEQSRTSPVHPAEPPKSPAIAALKTLTNTLPANSQASTLTANPAAAAQTATRTRGVKAMLSELLQD